MSQTMIKLIGPPIPHEVFVACSGGVDSMAAVSFLTQIPSRLVRLAFFHHGTVDSENAFQFLTGWSRTAGLELVVGRLVGEKEKGQSPEEFWRNKRYEFLHGLAGTVVLAHHLDDQVEQYVFSMLNGSERLIPYRNGNAIRPFLLTPKSVLADWCERKGVAHVTDLSNDDVHYCRNRIRKNILPEAYVINPGLRKVVGKKIVSMAS